MELASKRLVLVSGKGGVGKTTCSAAVALELARQGRKTLLVTVDPARRLADSLGVDVGADEMPIQPNLSAMMLDPEAVIREHLEREVPQADVTGHPLFRYVTQSLPGLNELMAIGKLNDLRREGRYDVIVVDTAPTGHALSFLFAPQAIEELMSDRSLVRWAIRAYGLWRRLSGAARGMQGLFGRPKDEVPPDLDFERIFLDIQEQAQAIRAFLTDPEHSAFVVVTLPEKLPVEETVDLEHMARGRLGMQVHSIVVNKVQPDPLAGRRAQFDHIVTDPKRRASFAHEAAKATGEEAALVEALLDATRFAEVRRAMNEAYIAELAERLPGIPLVRVPLQAEDVQGLKRLEEFRKLLFPTLPSASARRGLVDDDPSQRASD